MNATRFIHQLPPPTWKRDHLMGCSVCRWLTIATVTVEKNSLMPIFGVEHFKKKWNPSAWQFFVTFLGWLSDLLERLSDLQRGDKKVKLNHLVVYVRWEISTKTTTSSNTPRKRTCWTPKTELCKMTDSFRRRWTSHVSAYCLFGKSFLIVASCKSSVVFVWKKNVVSNGDLLHGRIRETKHQLNKQKKTGSRKFEPILTPQKDRQTLKKGEPPLPSMGLVYLPTWKP